MGASPYVLLLLLATFLLCSDHASTHSIPPRNDTTLVLQPQQVNPPPVSYFTLVLQWPNGVCSGTSNKCKLPVPSTFTIHGLWPSPKTSKVAPPYDDQAIKDLKPELQRKWPSLFDPDYTFWKHEWEAHGKDSQLNQANYFRDTMLLYDGLDLKEGLRSRGVKQPGLYYLKDFQSALNDLFTWNGELVCNQNRAINRQQVSEFRFNYSSYLQLQGSTSVSSNCDITQKILFV